MRIFYKRSGERVSKAKVKASQLSHALTFETGKGPFGARVKNAALAKRWREMTIEEFCRESGAFTYR